MVSEGEWFTGPQGWRRKYRVRDTRSLPGGRGFVFPAERVDDGMAVGLKIIEEDDSTTAARIESCYATLRRHPHPNLIEPLSLFVGPGLFSGDSNDPPDSDSDLLYLAYRWIDGRTLRAAAPLDAVGTARLASDLAAAITHLHGVCWLIHRDIHPGNIVIDTEGRAALIDIDAWVEVGDTRAAPASGVLGFLPPERSRAPWDQRSDVWALGMVINYALLGHPTGNDSVEEVAAELGRVLPRGANPDRVALLTSQLTATDPDDRRTDLVEWADELTEALSVRRSRLGSRIAPGLIVGSAAVAAAVAGVAFGWWLADHDGPNPPGDPSGDRAELLLPPDGGGGEPGDGTDGGAEHQQQSQLADAASCSIALGEPAPHTAVQHFDDIERWADELAAAAPDSCALDHAEVYGQAVFQLVEVDGDEMVVLVSRQGTVLLHPVQMRSYQQIAGRGSELAMVLGGYPVEVLDPRPGVGSLVRLSEGGLLVGRRADTQAFWMSQPVFEMWESLGGFDGPLGLPMTNPFTIADALQQDFEHGLVHLPVTSAQPWLALNGEDLEVTLVAEPPGALPSRSGILRQPNGTAWWFADGRRHWIPDGGVWNCLGGHDNVVFNDIDGVTLASIPLATPASCGMAG